MNFDDIDLGTGRAFVAMEYCYLILNRTLLVVATDSALVGIKIRGITSAGGPMSVQGDLNDIHSYMNRSMIDKYWGMNLNSDRLLEANSANFRIFFKDIRKAFHDPSSKWGMGYYPHDGKIYVETSSLKKELIILGEQSGNDITKMLNAAIR
jgi:hypothetical protein